jgi:hypothetical protein
MRSRQTSQSLGGSLASLRRPAGEEAAMHLGADNPLELVFVFLTIGISLALLVAFGQWWQR